jgi:hypothetical protein
MKSLEQSLSQKSLPRVTSPPGTAKKLSLVDARQQASVLAQLKHVDNLLQIFKSMVRRKRDSTSIFARFPFFLDLVSEST